MNKINFQDIQAQHLNRYRLVKVDGTADEYDLTPVRGAVTQEGTPIRALELNQLQDNIDAAKADKDDYAFPLAAGTTTGTAPHFVLTLDPPLTAYTPGLMLNVKFHTAMAFSATNYLNVNGLGDIIIVYRYGSSVSQYITSTVPAGIHTLMYDGTYWVLMDSLSVYGVAVGAVYPSVNAVYALGKPDSKWSSLYANNVYQNGYKAWDSSSLPYASGTWEPKLKGSGSEYSGSNYITTPDSSGTGATFGFYTRIGDIVHGSFMWYYSGAFTSISKADPLYIKLPFAAGCFTNFPISYYTGITKSTINPMFGTMAYNSAYATLRFGSAESFTALQGSHIYGNANVRFSSTFSYKIKE